MATPADHSRSGLARANRRSPPSQVGASSITTVLCVRDARLSQKCGCLFPNPVGLAAGFDKDGLAALLWSSLGFGFAELGTVTLHAQPGIPVPAGFAADLAALNRMGFNNCGAAAMAARLTDTVKTATRPIPIGINLGKSKVTPLDEAAADYLGSFRVLKDWGDYFVVNVFTEYTRTAIAPRCRWVDFDNGSPAAGKGAKANFVKIAPDLEWRSRTSSQ